MLGVGNSMCKALGLRERIALLKAQNNFGLNRALSMKQEVRRVVTGELSWGQVHEVLELYPVWGFEWSGEEGVPAMIRFVALKDDPGCCVEHGQEGWRVDTIRGIGMNQMSFTPSVWRPPAGVCIVGGRITRVCRRNEQP